MKFYLQFCVVITFVFISSIAFSAEKVVVIPLNSNTLGDSWIRVYDDNNQFLGYTNTPLMFRQTYTDPIQIPIISSKNYYSFTYWKSFETFLFQKIDEIYYLTSNCTGKKYHGLGVPLHKIGNGQVWDFIASINNDAIAYYTKSDTPPVILPSGDVYYIDNYIAPCAGRTAGADQYLYELFPNDYDVTGFKESKLYNLPFNLQYNLPKTP